MLTYDNTIITNQNAKPYSLLTAQINQQQEHKEEDKFILSNDDGFDEMLDDIADYHDNPYKSSVPESEEQRLKV